MKRWMMAASLCAAMAGGFAQEAEPAAAAPEPVLVLGQRPGPGMWKVSRDGHVLWVLGTYAPLPKQFAWRSRQVETVIANSQGYLLPPSAQIGGLGFFKTLALLPYAIGIKKNPDGATLREVLPPEVYARWLPMRKKYFDDSSSIERERPMFVAEELYRRAIKQAGLDNGAVDRQINEMVGKSKLKKTPVTLHLTVEDPASVLKSFKASKMDDAVCLASTLKRLDSDVDGMRARAQAWANGNFAAIAAFDYESGERACSSEPRPAHARCVAGGGRAPDRRKRLHLRHPAARQYPRQPGRGRPAASQRLHGRDAGMRPDSQPQAATASSTAGAITSGWRIR